MLQLLANARNLEAGHLDFAADAARHILPAIAAFRAAYPQITFTLSTGNSEYALGKLNAFDVEFAVTAERPKGEGYVVCKLRDDPVVAFVAADHPFAGKRSIGFKALCAAGLVMREPGSVTRKLLEDEAFRRGLSIATSIEVEGREAARETVAAGLGVGIVSRSEFLRDDQFKVLAVNGWDAVMEEWLVCLEARQELHLIKSFMALAATVP